MNSESQAETQAENDNKSKITFLPNAILIKRNRGAILTDTVKALIKKNAHCYWDSLKNAWVGPIENKDTVKKIIEEHSVKAEIQEITWTLKKSKIAGKESQLEIIEQRIFRMDTELIVELNKIDKYECEFNNPPKEINHSIESDDLRYLIEKNLHEKVHTIKELKKEAENVRAAITSLENESDDLQIAINAIQDNEYGDARLFCNILGNTYLFDPTEGASGEFYIWNGIKWKKDIVKQVTIDFIRVAQIYQVISENNAYDDELKDMMGKRANALKTQRRRNAVLSTVKPMLSKEIIWDKIPNKLPCMNGILDLQTGEFSEMQPEMYVRNLCNIQYNKTATCPKFDQFLNEITMEDQQLAEFIARIVGYCVMGTPKEEKVFYFYGSGRNGKGTLMKVLQHILGDLCKSFPSEMLLLQRNPSSSSSASPDLAALEGTRLAVFSEINENRKIDSAKVKNLSGRDTISCRKLFSNINIQIDPVHTMILQTNYKPEAASEDKALWARTILVPFKASFADNPKENLKADLIIEAEGILNWIIKGCKDYQQNGLSIPQSVKDETESYRQENDPIGLFLKDMCVFDSAFSARKAKTQAAIKDYCVSNGFPIPKQKTLYSYLNDKFTEHRDSYGTLWLGFKILESQ